MKRLLAYLIILGLFFPAITEARKWSELTALTTVATGDIVAIIDVSATPDVQKRITWGELMGAPGAIGGTTPAAGRFTSVHTPEITTPTPIANYGITYWKSDNKLYGQDGAGVEHVVELGSSDYGEMGNVYGSSATEVLHSNDEWHGMFHANITGSAPHLNSGFSFVAGKDGSGNITSAQAGAAINIADAAHGLLDDDIVTVQSANHVGVGTVVYVDSGNFEVDIAYVGDEASTWQMGSYLLVATSGTYRGAWNASFSQSLNNTQTSIITPFVNTTQSTKAVAARLLANNTDVGSIGGNGLMAFSANDRIWFAAQTTAAQTLTFTIRNVTLH